MRLPCKIYCRVSYKSALHSDIQQGGPIFIRWGCPEPCVPRLLQLLADRCHCLQPAHLPLSSIACKAGAEVLVVGSYLFSQEDMTAAIAGMRFGSGEAEEIE